MKKQYYYWIGAAVIVVAVVVALFLWKGKPPFGKKIERMAAEETPAPELVLRELQQEKADEEKFLEAIRQQTGKTLDSLSAEQQLHVLLQLADDGEATNRLLAIRKLGEIETLEISRAEKLIAKLEDENTWVVEEAVLTLMKLRTPEAAEPLRQLYAELQKQPKIEYIPFRNTAMMAIHGQVAGAAGVGESGTDFSFQLTSFKKSENTPSAELADREKIALFILPEFEMCLTWPNFKACWEKLASSDFAKQLVQLQAWQDFKTATPFNRFFKMQEKLNGALGPLGGKINYLVDPLGDEVYTALYPSDHDNNIILVTPANLKAQAVNTLLKTLGTVQSGDLIVEKQQYRGQSLFTVSLAPKTSIFHYAVVDGYLIISDDQQLLARAIASYLDADESSLAFQPAFRQSLKQVDKKSFLVAYLDPEKFFDLKKGQQISETLVATVEKALYEITGESGAFPADSLSRPATTLATPAPAVETQALHFIPAAAIFCYGTAAINPQAFWHYVTTMRAEREAIRNFETRSNLNLGRDLISKLDNQLLYFFAGIDTTGPRFFRRQLLGVRLREQQGIEKYGRSLLAYLYSPKDGVQAEEYEGAKIHYVQGPTTFEPNFAVVDGYLLMAFDRATLRAAIDAGQKRTDSIAQNPGFAAARGRLTLPENSLAYFNADQFLDSYRNFLVVYDRQTNLFDQSDLQTRIDPLFVLLKSTFEMGAGKITAEGNGEIVFGMR